MTAGRGRVYVGTETTSSGSPFQIQGPETLKVWLPTVESWNIGTTRRLEMAERSAHWPCRSATRRSGPRYHGAVSCRTLYVSTEISYWMRSGTPVVLSHSVILPLKHFNHWIYINSSLPCQCVTVQTSRQHLQSSHLYVLLTAGDVL